MTAGSLAIIALALIAIGVPWILALFIRTHLQSSQGAFFRQLGIGRADKKLLFRLARSLGESDPLPLLIGRGCFENAVAASELQESEMLRVERLRDRLFSTP